MRITRFSILATGFLLTLLSSSIIAAPHHPRSAGDNDTLRWLEARRSEIAAAEEAHMCPNVAAPLDQFIDFSVKFREMPVEKKCASSLSARTDTTTYACDEDNPCSNGACCAKTGYCGYGPDSCGTTGTSPNDACWSNCDAHAECGQYALVANATCPLNVCCSQYGFCGTTDDFCSTGCQSDCEQPDSGSSNGDVQKRIIGYYESWAHDRTCSGMTFQNIPVGSLTHLHFSFGYVSPDTFEIGPMDGNTADLFNDMTSLKSQNTGIKMIISLGGWSFSDNDTTTQAVFPDMVSSKANRSKFIKNLIAFMVEYAFDGVDFDWEYPGAPDRGGSTSDGVNYTEMLKELKTALAAETKDYVVSFTSPTSYWYLRHFDLENMMEHVDYTNLMAYDLHGTWDASDPIGNVVLAHTNLTEINLALDLFWRNNVDPSKINLGLGFYGRSFQLSDSSCWEPGCSFKGPGTAGTCTKSSGTLSYKEIQQIVNANDLEPYYDEDAAVKYITWDNDQWVSYDDKETFQQKIAYANGQGLGGLLIWAIDLDTDELDALQAVIYPDTLNAFNDATSDASYWQEASEGSCRVTDCGGTCVAGEIKITSQPCGGATAVTRHSTKKDSQLCCPLAAAPDPSNCRWRGTAPSCNGHCQDGEIAMEQNRWGSGDYCESGSKVYCCAVEAEKSTGCRTTDCGGKCKSDEVSMAGEFMDNCALEPKQLCCASDNTYTNCDWHGKDGSCSDNVCDINTQIQLTESYDGGDANCGIHLERERVFCCDTPSGQSPWLPVPLDYLFPNPPTGSDVDSEYKLSVDDTWGGQTVNGDDSTPDDAAFGFFIMTSPETIQTTLDKRDGSHWELFDCFDAESESEQTIRMFCNDQSTNSNCHKISLGKGVPGTILEMPSGCGPGRYAVAKDMRPSKNQTIPEHVARRDLVSAPVVYDLTFDYDFRRVPRDDADGSTQIRLDYSNQKGYWDGIVDKAGSSKRKRTLDDFGGNHKRWLEDAWREDHRTGLVSRDELHERWFGEDVVEWIKSLLSVASDAPIIEHSVSETLDVVLIDESYTCELGGVDVAAKLNVQAETQVSIDTSFGLTIITSLALPLDLSKSYLYFKNKGSVKSLFTIDALTSASFSTGDKELFGLENFGATFSVPGILTVGPNFRIFGSVNGDISLAGHIESQVNLASWEVQQTYPDQESDENPKSETTPDRDGTQKIGSPTFNYSVTADGQITAHVKPTVTFGLDFNKNFLDVGSAKVDLVADGSVQLYATATTSNDESTFCYGVNAKASLYASVDAPSAFGWDLSVSEYAIASVSPVALIPETCPLMSRNIDTFVDRSYWQEGGQDSDAVSSVAKRSTVIGPLLRLNSGLTCPSDSSSSSNVSSCPLCDDESSDELSLSQRDGGTCYIDSSTEEHCPVTDTVSRRGWYEGISTFLGNRSILSERSGSTKFMEWDVTSSIVTENVGKWKLSMGVYPNCGEAKPISKIEKWFGFGGANEPCNPTISQKNGRDVDQSTFVTEHVFETQIVSDFFKEYLLKRSMPAGYERPSKTWITQAILGIAVDTDGTWDLPAIAQLGSDGNTDTFSIMTGKLGSTQNPNNLALAAGGMNGMKGHLLGGDYVNIIDGSGVRPDQIAVRNFAGIFTYLAASTKTDTIWNKFMRPSNWIDLTLFHFDQNYPWGTRDGEPTYTENGVARQPSMRYLWSQFIDAHLNSVEAKARSSITAAASNFETYHPYKLLNSVAQQNWYIEAFGTNGWATEAKMKLPRVAGVGTFGVYGNPAMTFAANGGTVNIGTPTPSSG